MNPFDLQPGCRWRPIPDEMDAHQCLVCRARITGLEIFESDRNEILSLMLGRCDFTPEKFLDYFLAATASVRKTAEDAVKKLGGDSP